MTSIADHPLFRRLLAMRLPADDYVVAGSGPLFAHGLRQDINDLDVVARKDAWQQAAEQGHVTHAPYGENVQVVYLADDDIEILDGWFPDGSEKWSVDHLIDSAEVIDGIRFLPLHLTLEWKKKLARDQDREDIAILEKLV